MSTARAHLEKAVKRLRVAEKLLHDGEYEDAISRAYYAMYHAAKAALATLNVFPTTHGGVVSEFGRKFVLTGIFPRELGKALAGAKPQEKPTSTASQQRSKGQKRKQSY